MPAYKLHVIHIRICICHPLHTYSTIVITAGIDTNAHQHICTAFRRFYHRFRTAKTTECSSTFVQPELSAKRMQAYQLGIGLHLQSFGNAIPALGHIDIIVLVNSLLDGLRIIRFPISLCTEFAQIHPCCHCRQCRDVHQLGNRHLLYRFNINQRFIFRHIHHVIHLQAVVV